MYRLEMEHWAVDAPPDKHENPHLWKMRNVCTHLQQEYDGLYCMFDDERQRMVDAKQLAGIEPEGYGTRIRVETESGESHVCDRVSRGKPDRYSPKLRCMDHDEDSPSQDIEVSEVERVEAFKDR